MSEPDLAYMTANEDFDLPRWQTHHTQSSISQDPAYSSFSSASVNPNPSAAAQALGPPPQQRNTVRVTHLQGQDLQMGSPYGGTVGRSNSLQTSSSSRRRQHHTTDDLEVRGGGGNVSYSSPQQQQQPSLYPHAVAYAQQGSREELNVIPDGGMSYLNSHQTPKRASGIESHSATSSPLRSNVLLDPYVSSSQQQQQSPYSPSTANSPPGSYPFSPNDPRNQSYQTQQQQQSRTRAPSSIKAEMDSPPIGMSGSNSYIPQSAASSPYTPNNMYPMDMSHSASPLSQSQQQQQQNLPFSRSSTHHSVSTPSTPLSYGTPQTYYTHDTPMSVEPPPPQRRRPVGFRRIRDVRDLRPMMNNQPTGRRIGPDGSYLSPVKQLTLGIIDTYHICNPQFRYESAHNPRRVLTKPSKPAHNDGYDNEDYDYILYVNDILGGEDGNKYLILDVLGQGTFGQVVKCQNIRTNEVVAVKVVKNKPAYFNQSMMEVTILQLLNTQCDPNDKHHLLRMRDSFIHKNHLCLVFELLSSNLYELIKQNQFQGLSTQLVKVFTAQLLDAMTILKEARLIHCDLKPENILLKSLQSPEIKIIDFGSACHERQTVYTYIQSRFYRSPEVLLGLQYTASIDMWSLGCIAVELFLGLPLFPGTSEYNQITRIVEMIGMPSNYMLENGKQSHQFFDSYTDHYGQKKYRLKSLEQYSREHNTQEQPGKQYFKATNLPDIINTAPMPAFKSSSRQAHEEQKELNNRASFIDFCQGLLNLDPIQRWSPQQARLHPFITGEKFTKPYVPQKSVPMQVIAPVVAPANPAAPVQDPKRPYGGLVPTQQPKGSRAYQDAASYNQHLAQHQAYTSAQAQAASQAAAFRNPYLSNQSQPVPDNSNAISYGSQSTQYTTTAPPVAGPRDNTSNALKTNIPPSLQPSYNTSTAIPNTSGQAPGTTPNYYTTATRARSNTINDQLDVVPPALARLQHMNQDVIGRNALTPVLNRDDAMREWERRQNGKQAVQGTSYQPLELLQQQAELAASNGQGKWSSAVPAQSGRYQPPTSKLSHSYAPAIVVDDDRNAQRGLPSARSDASGSAYNSPAIAAPPQSYSGAFSSGSNRNTISGFPQQSQSQPASATTMSAYDTPDRRADIGSIYVPMQPDQYQSPYSSASTQVPSSRHTMQPATAIPTSFYGSGTQASGHVTPSVQAIGPRNPFNSNDLSRIQTQGGNTEDARRQTGLADQWPRQN